MSAIETIYVEREVRDHPRTRAVLERLPRARRVGCERYGEVFNRRAQSFRLQKERPALILAAKHDGHVLPAPAGYSVGARHNFYFSHLLNCPYDCRYCFLQGMFRSAHYVLFVNYEEFQRAIDERLTACGDEGAFFFSGYDGDSLALEGVSGFCDEFLPFFARRPRARLELRTKSARVSPLERRTPLPNCVVATSFTPRQAWRRWEQKVPSIRRRLDAMERLGRAGWPLGLRFDPLLWWPGCQGHYERLFDTVFDRLDEAWIHSVSFGAFRLPRPFFRRLLRQYPEEELLAAPLAERRRIIGYREDLESELLEGCLRELARRVPSSKIFPATSSPETPPVEALAAAESRTG